MSWIFYYLHIFDRFAFREETPKQTGTRIPTPKPWEHDRLCCPAISSGEMLQQRAGQRANVVDFEATDGLCCMFSAHTGRVLTQAPRTLTSRFHVYTLNAGPVKRRAFNSLAQPSRRNAVLSGIPHSPAAPAAPVWEQQH